MLKHLSQTPVRPERVVVIGANGFVGNAIMARLDRLQIPSFGLTRTDVNLARDGAGARLAAHLRTSDAVVVAAAKAPCRTLKDFVENACIARNLDEAFRIRQVTHLVNISSDAVYTDEPLPLTESSPTAPSSLHGAMHLAREIALHELGLPVAILRPTLIYGAFDSHDGYGPNLFRRQANAREPISLFGEGEERRDHVSIEDVAEITVRVLLHKSVGTLNVASGQVFSFWEIADLAMRLAGTSVDIIKIPRKGPMPHNGYRPFDISATRTAFPDFKYEPLRNGMARAQTLEFTSLDVARRGFVDG